jgi:hypothetical protein
MNIAIVGVTFAASVDGLSQAVEKTEPLEQARVILEHHHGGNSLYCVYW